MQSVKWIVDAKRLKVFHEFIWSVMCSTIGEDFERTKIILLEESSCLIGKNFFLNLDALAFVHTCRKLKRKKKTEQTIKQFHVGVLYHW